MDRKTDNELIWDGLANLQFLQVNTISTMSRGHKSRVILSHDRRTPDCSGFRPQSELHTHELQPAVTTKEQDPAAGKMKTNKPLLLCIHR